jgi:hypothetical protein
MRTQGVVVEGITRFQYFWMAWITGRTRGGKKLATEQTMTCLMPGTVTDGLQLVEEHVDDDQRFSSRIVELMFHLPLGVEGGWC